MAHSLWRDGGSVIYGRCWASPAQSVLGPSPAGFMTILYFLNFETLPTWRVRFLYLLPQEHISPVEPPGIGFVWLIGEYSQWVRETRGVVEKSKILARDCCQSGSWELRRVFQKAIQKEVICEREHGSERHWKRHSGLRRLSTCCSEMQSVWNSDSAVYTCSYDP
jgi:hypothetical protein